MRHIEELTKDHKTTLLHSTAGHETKPVCIPAWKPFFRPNILTFSFATPLKINADCACENGQIKQLTVCYCKCREVALECHKNKHQLRSLNHTFGMAKSKTTGCGLGDVHQTVSKNMPLQISQIILLPDGSHVCSVQTLFSVRKMELKHGWTDTVSSGVINIFVFLLWVYFYVYCS